MATTLYTEIKIQECLLWPLNLLLQRAAVLGKRDDTEFSLKLIFTQLFFSVSLYNNKTIFLPPNLLKECYPSSSRLGYILTH